MDDLFSKAGRHYPLKTDTSDWEAVAKQLADGNTPPPDKPKNGFGYGWLSILIIPILFFAVKKADLLSGKGTHKQLAANTTIHAEHKSEQTSKSATTQQKNNSKTTIATADENARIEASAEGVNGSEIALSTKESEINIKDKLTTQPNGISSRTTKLKSTNNTISATDEDRPTEKSSLKSGGTKKLLLTGATNTTASKKRNPNRLYGRVNDGAQRPAILNHLNDEKEELSASRSLLESNRLSNELKNSQAAELFGRLLKFGPNWNGLSVGDRGALFNGDSILAKPYQQIPARSSLLPDRYFYYGVNFAPDLSSIKWQSIKSVGYNIGVLVGYHFANRLSIEGGFLWDKKKYYSDGKYFDKTKAGFPSYVDVLNVDGGCDMFEIPIALRYDFSYKPSTFFASVGFNSYLMKKEDYDYNAYVSTNGVTYPGHHTYRNSGNNWLASLSLSAGYSLKVARHTNIRFEPFYNVPLRKIGSGNMPLTSTGINLSLVQKIP